MLFTQAAKENEIIWLGVPGGRYITVHMDDLGELFRLTGEKYPLVKGFKTECSNPAIESVDFVLQQTLAISGASGYKYKKLENAFKFSLSATSIVRGTLRRDVLGWTPVKSSLIDGHPAYYRSALAFREQMYISVFL